ncbi:hypothetical protein PLANPX_1699 [Lacipirellula parvula]|uniref:Uncharacterized protein n=1 Tax=Lacipirellula parvula TaxID=2650471 RepID=A0A5K7X8D6_9BACT|nr:hypothetical protein PLANPX_1699 [Lacipirellula parvula]
MILFSNASRRLSFAIIFRFTPKDGSEGMPLAPPPGRRSTGRRRAFVTASSSSMYNRFTISRMTSRGEVLAGGLVGEFRELPDQLLEHGPHLRVADNVGVEVDVGELLGH